MAHAVDDGAIVGGTLPYLSPEVLASRPAEEADDVWSLRVVLDEIASERHPFASGALEAVRSRIRAPRAAATAVAAFAASILTAPRSQRPGTASAFAAALAAVSGNA